MLASLHRLRRPAVGVSAGGVDTLEMSRGEDKGDEGDALFQALAPLTPTTSQRRPRRWQRRPQRAARAGLGAGPSHGPCGPSPRPRWRRPLPTRGAAPWAPSPPPCGRPLRRPLLRRAQRGGGARQTQRGAPRARGRPCRGGSGSGRPRRPGGGRCCRRAWVRSRYRAGAAPGAAPGLRGREMPCLETRV